MDQVDLMDKTECSAFVSPCGPTGPLKTLFTHLTTETIPVFFYIFLRNSVTNRRWTGNKVFLLSPIPISPYQEQCDNLCARPEARLPLF